MNYFQQNWLKVLECVEALFDSLHWVSKFCEVKYDIFEGKKTIKSRFKQPCIIKVSFLWLIDEMDHAST